MNSWAFLVSSFCWLRFSSLLLVRMEFTTNATTLAAATATRALLKKPHPFLVRNYSKLCNPSPKPLKIIGLIIHKVDKYTFV